MKTIISIGLLSSIMVISLGQCTTALEETTAETVITDDIAAHLQFMREEEYLAHDVYLYLYDVYELRPFDNIRKSEFVHTNAVKTLLDRYEIEDPSVDHEAGVFVNDDIQDLYNQLIEDGNQSLEKALQVGMLIEEKDIYDLNMALLTVDEESDIHFTLSNLLRASGNHLRAFHFNLEVRGFEYTPVILELEEYNEILNN